MVAMLSTPEVYSVLVPVLEEILGLEKFETEEEALAEVLQERDIQTLTHIM